MKENSGSQENISQKDKKTKRDNIEKMYDISETDDGFEVIMPGLINREEGWIMGTSNAFFENREEAERAVEKSKEDRRIDTERRSLEKTFTDYFYRIDKSPDGKYNVTLPGLKDSKAGYYVGSSSCEFNSWDEAKDFYLKFRESDEQLSQKPILEVWTSESEKVSFSNLDSFNPNFSPSEKSHEIPLDMKEYILKKDYFILHNGNGGTYQETLKEKDWERKIFSFISSYLKNEHPEIFKELGIKSLDSLTPKQAVELSTNIAVDLSKYKNADAGVRFTETEEDKKSALTFLQDGLKKRNDSSWEGNGVCRNIASTVKAIFESLRASQTKFNLLRNVYCTFEAGSEYRPERGRQFGAMDHAWNNFIAISKEGKSNVTIVDATWAKRDYETKKFNGLDHTLTRMEAMVYEAGINLDENSSEVKEQVDHILNYYKLKTERLGGSGGHVSKEEEAAYFLSRALKITDKHDFYERLGDDFIQKYSRIYSQKEISSVADKSEIEMLWKLKKANDSLSFHTILKGYLSNKKMDSYEAHKLIVGDNELQREIFEEMKLKNGFDNFIKEVPEFRIRMREFLPQLFLGFSPETKPEDARELICLLPRSLSGYKLKFNLSSPSEKDIKDFFEKVRQSLSEINPQRYEENIAKVDDYQLIKNYERIKNKLRSK
jgi:hypothetical protein